jgi:hypothetical protein
VGGGDFFHLFFFWGGGRGANNGSDFFNICWPIMPLFLIFISQVGIETNTSYIQ